MTSRRLLSLLGSVTLLLAVTPMRPAPAAPAVPAAGAPSSWLAAGDSFSAGHALPASSGACNTGSGLSWPQRARDRLRWSGRFDDASCSGTILGDVFNNPKDPSRQWNGTRYDLMTFSYGGNDVHFAEILRLCVGASILTAPTDGFNWLLDSVGSCPPDEAVEPMIDGLADDYRSFLESVANDVMNVGGNVVVMGYPAIFEDPDKWNTTAKVTGLCHGVDGVGARRVRGWAGRLNAVIGRAVAAVNGHGGVRFTFINPQDGVGNIAPAGPEALWEQPGSPHRHNLCGSDSWMYGPLDGQFHPNPSGHDAMSMLAERTIARLDWSGLNPPTVTTPPATTRPTTPPTTPPTSPPTAPPTTAPRPGPQSRDLVVVIYGGGHVGVAWDLTWDPGRDPVFCHFLIDGAEAFTAQCGLHSSKQFYGISPGAHTFAVFVTDRDGIKGNTLGPVTRTVT